MTNLDRMQAKIRSIKQALFDLEEMRPGALSKQYNVCGKPGCRCKDPRKPQRHGPYYQVSYTHRGKSTTEFVRRENVDEVKVLLANYARFRKLTEEWVALSLRIAQERRRLARRS